MSKNEYKEFESFWNTLPSNKQVILELFGTGKCAFCGKIVAKPSTKLTSEYAVHYYTTHGMSLEELTKVFSDRWKGEVTTPARA